LGGSVHDLRLQKSENAPQKNRGQNVSMIEEERGQNISMIEEERARESERECRIDFERRFLEPAGTGGMSVSATGVRLEAEPRYTSHGDDPTGEIKNFNFHKVKALVKAAFTSMPTRHVCEPFC
jgi:hypothetical protein